MTQRQLSYGAGVAFVAAGASCWSLGGALVRLTEGIDVWQIIFYRSVTVLICMGSGSASGSAERSSGAWRKPA
jgi:hypothetical protein